MNIYSLEDFFFEVKEYKATELSQANETLELKLRKMLMDGVDRQVVYLLAAFADEIMLEKPENRDFWRQNLLEERIFETHFAGEEIFNFIEEVLAKKNEPYLTELCLMLLGLGFQGKYKSSRYLQELKLRLARQIFGPIQKKLLCENLDRVKIVKNIVVKPKIWPSRFLVILVLSCNFLFWLGSFRELNFFFKVLEQKYGRA